MLNRTLLTIGQPFGSNDWVICISNDKHRFVMSCGKVDWHVPCHGKELKVDEIKTLIAFLESSIKEENDEQSNME